MSLSSDEFILNWLNQNLNLNPPITDISKDFSNGYKFAILLNALNELTKEELNEFKDSTDLEDIKENFKKLKNYFYTKLNIYLREDELNDVINKDASKSGVILYKIKNAVYKKKINFLEIKASSTKPSQEENQKEIEE